MNLLNTEIQQLAAFFGVVSALSPLGQVWRILRHKSSHDVSVLAFLLPLINQFWWLSDGIVTHNESLIVANSVALIVSIMCVVFILVYRS